MTKVEAILKMIEDYLANPKGAVSPANKPKRKYKKRAKKAEPQ